MPPCRICRSNSRSLICAIRIEVHPSDLTPCEAHKPEEDDCAQDCNDQAVQIETGNARCPEEVHQHTADKGTHCTHGDVEEYTLRRVGAHNKRGDPSCDATQNDE